MTPDNDSATGSNSGNAFVLAIQQHVPTPCDTATSLSRLSQAAALAAEEGANLLQVPEASLSGYNISVSEAQSQAEPADGPSAQFIATLCQKHELAIAYGFIERSGNQLFNTVQVINRAGDRVALYRKTHLWGDLDRRLFSPGDALPEALCIDGWKLGLLICYDVEFPETVRHLALEGAELVLVSTALMSPFTTIARRVVPIRAYENQVFVSYVNYCGAENDLDYIGHSCIVGPDGEDLARARSDPALLVATLHKSDITAARELLPYHRDRRPTLYRSLSS